MFQATRRRALLTALGTLFATLCALILILVCAPHAADSRNHFQGVLIIPKTSITPGQALDCDVQLEGGPEAATIYSYPAGAVSWSGIIQNGNVTRVSATTASSITQSSVTLYLVTDGATSISAPARLLNNDAPEGPGGR